MQPTTFEKPVRAAYGGTALSHLHLKLTLNMADRIGKRAVSVDMMSTAQALLSARCAHNRGVQIIGD